MCSVTTLMKVSMQSSMKGHTVDGGQDKTTDI